MTNPGNSGLAAFRPANLTLSARRLWPGIALSLVVALAASFVSATYGGPLLLYALCLGMAFHFLHEHASCNPGIDFCSKAVLRFGVALLGARITFSEVASLGIAPVAIAVGGLLTTLLMGWALSRWLRRPAAEGVLSGGAVAICGASAALAISAVLPQTRENEKFTLMTVVGVTGLSTIAMLAYPVIARLLGLDDTAAGIFIGATIHDVAQVVGAGYLISPHAGDVATFVKLTRVACLVPVVIALTIMFQTRPKEGTTTWQRMPRLPWFLVAFVWLMIANSLGYIPAEATGAISNASRACLVCAIAALGIKSSFQSFAALGWRPVIMLVAETVWIALFVLAALTLTS
ncbi:YeiH family protein [Lacisediminimonas profundi]|uniref:YeiH family protein n=1 Tax=Lacisediminimonas profundi TaxID=2603856 RepID=UPI00124B5A64|nr:putative sulfate exporter family transporter [Lacisediminimonas profundi]